VHFKPSWKERVGSVKPRVLIGKVGLDGHDRGAKVIARGLRDAGFDVIYTGIRQKPRTIAQAAVQEDVDAIGLSSLSGGHMANFTAVLEELEEMGRPDIPVYAGGIIPEEDAEVLRERGIKRIFGPGTELDEIVSCLEDDLSSPSLSGGEDAP
jgi:methylmalonyl-CoA mutase C-terminal domain/subunit